MTYREKIAGKGKYFTIGDIVPYITTAGTMKWTKINDFADTGGKNNIWHKGIDTITGVATFYPENYSFSYLNALKAYHAETPSAWIDARKERPKLDSAIIAEDGDGIFWGFYKTFNEGGSFHVNGIDWEQIYRWIPHPAD